MTFLSALIGIYLWHIDLIFDGVCLIFHSFIYLMVTNVG